MTSEIADAIEAGLLAQRHQEEVEQAIHGFDAWDELRLHPLIHSALRQAGWGVWPEQRYPKDRHKTSRSQGKRCDVVLTPTPDLPLRDPQIKATLFDTAPAVEPDQACWLEIKTVAQFETEGPFRRYAAELMNPVTQDVKKIHDDPIIRHGGLLLILFTQSQAIAEHDLIAWHEHCLGRGLSVACPSIRGFAINDRIGNHWCAVAAFGVRGM